MLAVFSGSDTPTSTSPSFGPFGYWDRTAGTPNTLTPRYSGDRVVIGDANSNTLSCPGAGANSERIGAGASTGTATGAIAFGQGATVGNGATDSIAIGRAASVVGVDNIVIGRSSTVSAVNHHSVIVGSASSTGQFDSVLLGHAIVNAGFRCVAVGSGSRAGSGGSSGSATAVGYAALAQGKERVAIGTDTVSASNNSFACGGVNIGSGNTGITSVLFGRGNTHTGAAVAVTHRGSNGTGTDVAGDNTVIQPGLGTGNSGATTGAITGGALTFSTGEPLGTGTTLQTATPRINIYPGGLIHVLSQIACAPTALASASNSTPINAADGNTFHAPLTENTTFANPTNVEPGATYVFVIEQDGAGGAYTVAFGTSFLFPGGTAPTISTGNGAIDVITAYAYSATQLVCTFAQDFQ